MAGNPALKAHGKVAVPPQLASDLEGWRKCGDTNGNDPESFIFPTRNGTCLIPTNWAEDVLKPAREKAEIPTVSYHWYRRGHATVQQSRRRAGQANPRPASPRQRRDHPERLHAARCTRDLESRGRFREVGERKWRFKTRCVAMPTSRFCASGLHSAPSAHNRYIEAQQQLLKTNAGGSNSVVESQPSKLLVAGSIPVSRSMFSIT